MASRQKVKGNRFERKLVEDLTEAGYDAERARGSDGRALGEAKEVDLLLRTGRRAWRIQAKIRAKLPEYLKVTEGVDLVMAREDRGETLVVMPLSTFLGMLE